MDLYRSTSTRLAGTTDDLALAVRALADKDAIRALGVLLLRACLGQPVADGRLPLR